MARSTGGAVVRLQGALAVVLTRTAWVPTGLTIVLPAVAAVVFVFVGGAGDWLLLAVGALLLVLNGVVQASREWWRRADERASDDEADRLRVAMKDALQPVVELMAAMPYQPRRAREAMLANVATQAVGSLVLLLKRVDRLRAVVYAMDPAGTRMDQLAHHGRGSTPSPFVAGDVRGDRALALVGDGASLFVRDLDREQPGQWEGSGEDYRTFISAAISNGEYAYGMVTVDAPRAGDLGENDEHIVLLVADLLAVAFAVADG